MRVFIRMNQDSYKRLKSQKSSSPGAQVRLKSCAADCVGVSRRFPFWE